MQRSILDKLQHLQDREDMKRFFSAEWWECAGVQSPLFDDEDPGDKPQLWHTNDKRVRVPGMGRGKESTPDTRPWSAPPSLPSQMQEHRPGGGVCCDGMAFFSFLVPVVLSLSLFLRISRHLRTPLRHNSTKCNYKTHATTATTCSPGSS